MSTKRRDGTPSSTSGADGENKAPERNSRHGPSITNSRRAFGLTALAQLSWPLAQAVTRRHGFASSEILRHWEHIVGPHLHAHCMPERLRFMPQTGAEQNGQNRPGELREGVLTIRAEGAAALELQHVTRQVMERINSYFGFAAVHRIKIVQGPLPRRRRLYKPVPKRLSDAQNRLLEERLAPIANPSLRQALNRLGQQILGEAGTLAKTGGKRGEKERHGA